MKVDCLHLLFSAPNTVVTSMQLWKKTKQIRKTNSFYNKVYVHTSKNVLKLFSVPVILLDKKIKIMKKTSGLMLLGLNNTEWFQISVYLGEF